MSLLTLQSSDNAQNPSSTDPAIIRNNFKDGVELRLGTEVGLVSLSINKIASFEIIQGVNDTFTWRIGGRTQFNQHKVIVPAGEYTGESLATAIKTVLDNSTILSNFKGAWTVTYDPTKFENDGSFTIDYGQNEVPDFNTNSFNQRDGSAGLEILNDNTNEVIVKGNLGTKNLTGQSEGDNIIVGEKGIFPNDGESVFRILPVKGFPLSTFTTTLVTGGILITENKLGTVRTFNLVLPTAGSVPDIAGWTYIAQYTGADPDEYWYFDPTDEGVFSIGSDGVNDATNPASWDIGTVYYNETNGLLQDTTAGGRTGTTAQDTGLKFSGNPENTSLAVPKVGIGYGNTKCGYVRNQLYQGLVDYPAIPDAQIQAQQTDGFDIMFEIRDNATFDGILIDLSQMIKNPAIEFPNPNWRNQSKYVFQNKTPANWDTIPGTVPAPSQWTNFDYASDHIQLKVQITNITNMKIFILHDSNGNGVFEEQQTLITMGQANNNMTKNIIEDFFPLRPCFTMINGGRYESKEVRISGRYDSEEILQAVGYEYPSGKAGYTEMDDTDPDYVDNSLLKADPPSNAVKLSALMLWGIILDGDLVSNGGTVPDADVPTPASRIANNIAPLIGFNTSSVYPSGQVSNPTSSQYKPTIEIREPNLLVELVDFNIKGYNGATGDRGKIIASIPAEELNTNSRTGTLNYFSQYPIMIDLNLAHDTIAYDLNVIIRKPNGQVAQDLVGTTAVSLLFKEGEESKQRRMMREQAEIIASSISNINQIKTDSVGMGFPKL